MFDNVDNPEDSSVKSQVKVMKANLGAECPIFVKAMLPSNVISGFVLVSLIYNHVSSLVCLEALGLEC
jgi:hypothetical protein